MNVPAAARTGEVALLVADSGRTEESASPVRMPGATTVCRCNGVSKRDIVKAWEGGAATLDAVVTATRATTGCGGCKEVVCGLVDWLNESDPETPLTEAPAAVGEGRSTPVTQRNITAPSSS